MGTLLNEIVVKIRKYIWKCHLFRPPCISRYSYQWIWIEKLLIISNNLYLNIELFKGYLIRYTGMKSLHIWYETSATFSGIGCVCFFREVVTIITHHCPKDISMCPNLPLQAPIMHFSSTLSNNLGHVRSIHQQTYQTVIIYFQIYFLKIFSSKRHTISIWSIYRTHLMWTMQLTISRKSHAKLCL